MRNEGIACGDDFFIANCVRTINSPTFLLTYLLEYLKPQLCSFLIPNSSFVIPHFKSVLFVFQGKHRITNFRHKLFGGFAIRINRLTVNDFYFIFAKTLPVEKPW